MAPLLLFAVLAIPVIVAITFHEAAHAYAAWALGDDTAQRAGRLTLNPFSHIDQLGTLVLPAIFLLTLGIAFGYANPVPVDANKFKNAKRDIILVALAGPMTNIALALLLALLLTATRSLAEGYPLWRATLHASIAINFIMAIVHFIPIPPLDAAKAMATIMPRILKKTYERVEPYGYLCVLFIFLVVPLASPWLGIPINTAGYVLIQPAYFLTDTLLGILGAA